ncbi:MAG: glycosyl hydrolase 53 family protein, partial [Gemmiger sp.]
LLWPIAHDPNWDAIAHLLLAGVRAVREFDSSIKVMIHLDNGGNAPLYRTWFDHFFARGGDCDVIGMSYYPFWHGTLDALRANTNAVARRYGKEIILVEMSMGFTMDSYADYEKLADEKRKGAATRPALTEKVPFSMTPQGQADFTQAILKLIEEIPDGKGRGFFWWEPGWIPVPGSGWATQPAWEYVHEKGPGGNEWANQALFDFRGNALPALDVIQKYQPR